MLLLQDKVVCITGASQGIGRGIALGCARAGAKVVVHHLNTPQATLDAGQVIADIEKERSGVGLLGPGAVQVAGDISDECTADEVRASKLREGLTMSALADDLSELLFAHQIVQAAVTAFGRIDCCVSNAGVCPFYAFLDIPRGVWRSTRAINLDGAFYFVQVRKREPDFVMARVLTDRAEGWITQACARQMKEQIPQGGSIVAVSSISALVGGGEQAHYTPTKAGVKSLMESCAISLAPYKIRCELPAHTSEGDKSDRMTLMPSKRKCVIGNSVLPGNRCEISVCWLVKLASELRAVFFPLHHAGTIETPINAEDLEDPVKRAYMEKRIPLSRLGRPEDLAGPAVFLLSEMAAYVTGAYVLVDGGAFVNLQ
ncbi:BZ3500_MvSof-1268-A1-R1_Chr3-2g06224 [Microbotryum saponariae]|uniref:BZ3500_MvSof-1268-A1-R1_Chr3-2g06224 protein n=1 Tax=Microbotryum saponariae TaxID=289078 RepID=A0A2X0LGB7_9BASI|nr:BZ3500_MvSof-1268-A1-R1_Chr3-2g06224 [Microbotryum saponariae]SDA04150.1 BZ3501_MvSof-1269-A2-R1_Chr3-2g05915 [Microbotryum saponariae]